jgi:hypothetical protein
MVVTPHTLGCFGRWRDLAWEVLGLEEAPTRALWLSSKMIVGGGVPVLLSFLGGNESNRYVGR